MKMLSGLTYQTTKIVGAENLLSFVKNDVNVAQQIDILLKFFPMFDETRKGTSYTFQIDNGLFTPWKTNLYTVFVFYDCKLVGYGQLLLRTHFAEMFNVIVKFDFKDQGIEKEILVELEDYAIINNKNQMILWCENHIKSFYFGFGYQLTDKEKIVDGLLLYQMEKNLVI